MSDCVLHVHVFRMLIPLCAGAKMYAAVSHNTIETHNWLSAFLSVAFPTGNSRGCSVNLNLIKEN